MKHLSSQHSYIHSVRESSFTCCASQSTCCAAHSQSVSREPGCAAHCQSVSINRELSHASHAVRAAHGHGMHACSRCLESHASHHSQSVSREPCCAAHCQSVSREPCMHAVMVDPVSHHVRPGLSTDMHGLNDLLRRLYMKLCIQAKCMQMRVSCHM